MGSEKAGPWGLRVERGYQSGQPHVPSVVISLHACRKINPARLLVQFTLNLNQRRKKHTPRSFGDAHYDATKKMDGNNA